MDSLGNKELGYFRNMKPIIEIDGSAFSSLEGFYSHFEDRALTEWWGHNLDAFNDVLRGGFGTPDGGFVLVWRNHKVSEGRLGIAETIRQLEIRSKRCHPSNIDSVLADLEMAKAGQFPTVFEWLVEIIERHGPNGTESEDGIDLVLS